MVRGFNHGNGRAVLSEEGREVMLWVAIFPHPPWSGEAAGSVGLLSLCVVLREQAGCINSGNELPESAGSLDGRNGQEAHTASLVGSREVGTGARGYTRWGGLTSGQAADLEH